MLVALASGGGLASLLVAALQRIESLTFWAFCFFEACIGVYFPSMGAQWAMVIDDGARAEIYNILRIPLNIFAVVALTTTIEGDSHRDQVFVCCAGLLLLSSLILAYWLKEEQSNLADDMVVGG